MALKESEIATLQKAVWGGSLPVEIRLAPVDCRSYDQSSPYLLRVRRLSYLPFLLPRLHGFFASSLVNPDVAPHEGWFSFQDVPMKWQHPVGLLYDLFSGAEAYSEDDVVADSHEALSTSDSGGRDRLHLPWKLTLHFSDWPSDQLIPLDASGKVHVDNFINSCKEADYLRGSGKTMMSLSKEDSTKLWQAVVDQDLRSFNSVNTKLLNPPGAGPFRNIPMKVYLPHADDSSSGSTPTALVRVVQGLVPPYTARELQTTVVTALHELLPTVFPSKRSFYHGKPVLHGTVVPPSAALLDLLKGAAYADGFLHIAIALAS